MAAYAYTFRSVCESLVMKLTHVFHLVQSLVLLLKTLTYSPKPCIHLSPIRATCPFLLNLLELIILIIFSAGPSGRAV